MSAEVLGAGLTELLVDFLGCVARSGLWHDDGLGVRAGRNARLSSRVARSSALISMRTIPRSLARSIIRATVARDTDSIGACPHVWSRKRAFPKR